MLDKEEVKERETGKERETNIDRARDRKESEDIQSSVQLGYKLFPVSICVLTPSSKGFVLVRHVCLCIYCIVYSRGKVLVSKLVGHREGKSEKSEVVVWFILKTSVKKERFTGNG